MSVNLKKWMESQQGRHICQCGCGEFIRILPDHHSRGIPKFRKGHFTRVRNPMRGRRGERNPNYKGGRFIEQQGYVLVLNPRRTGHRDRYVYEHRLVMERHLGRELTPNEQIHHRNGVKTDNRIENLEILNVSEHARLHQEELRERYGEELYLFAKRRIHLGLPYREFLTCSES